MLGNSSVMLRLPFLENALDSGALWLGVRSLRL